MNFNSDGNRFDDHAVPSREAAPYSILFLDDNAVFVKSICMLLKNYGMQCTGYSDSNAALEALATKKIVFDVFVTDYQMPGLSGIEVARKVRESFPSLPVILISGFIDNEVREQAAKVGVNEIIDKPFHSQDFVNLIRKVAIRAE